MKNNSIGNRMKENYEDRYRIKLTRRMPVIMRLDGKAFHTITRHCEKPFDECFAEYMDYTTLELCKEVQGTKCAYVQSDEMSLLLTDFDTLSTDAWFDYNIQKMVSVAAGFASVIFRTSWPDCHGRAVFDCRVFNIPKEEVCNYFIWRQQDWIRNSVHMLASYYFSHNELHKKSQSDMHEMLHQKGINWAKLAPRWKNGWFIYRDAGQWKESDAPNFIQEREWIERYLEPIED